MPESWRPTEASPVLGLGPSSSNSELRSPDENLEDKLRLFPLRFKICVFLFTYKRHERRGARVPRAVIFTTLGLVKPNVIYILILHSQAFCGRAWFLVLFCSFMTVMMINGDYEYAWSLTLIKILINQKHELLKKEFLESSS